MRARLAAALVTLITLLATAFPAFAAFTPPPLDAHVVDTSGALSEAQVRAIDRKLDGYLRRTGFAIVAFIPRSLEGESIEDVAYRTFNAWQIGDKGKDNGVLLIIAPSERKVRIETGKGVGGALTDLQTNDIINQTIVPLLQQGRVPEAVDRGTSAIARTLAADLPPDQTRSPGNDRARPPPAAPPSPLKIGAVAAGIFLVIVLAVVSPAVRSFLWFFLAIFFRGGGGGGGFGGGDGGSGYSGGGGRSGGGGSSDSY